ncbi:MAG: hypothetical protein ACOC4G_04315 [Bacillota bacterium]
MNDEIRAKILKKGVIVGGHPRSGTSLACQLVESAGVEFPSDFVGDEYNQAGYYELEASKELTKKLIEKAMTVENTLKMNKIIDRLNDCKVGGLKIVRIPAIFFYLHVARKLKTVFIFRNPADVKASLLRRGISRFEPDWFENNNALIAAHENIENSIIISYERLLKGDQKIKKVFSKIGLNIDLNLIQNQQRTQARSSIVISNKEKKLYDRLKKLEEECF